MALINCPECGKQVSDSANSCPNCGFGVDAFIQRKKAVESIRLQSKKEAIEYVKKKKIEEQESIENEYNKACSLYKTVNTSEIFKIEQAISIFKSLGEYKDSKDMIDVCEKRMHELKVLKEKETIAAKKEKNKKYLSVVLILVEVFSLILAIDSLIKYITYIPKNEKMIYISGFCFSIGFIILLLVVFINRKNK